MVTISLCMIVKNEESVLERCLDSVKNVADEMIIVDTGSEDRTKEIAASFGAKVFEFPWIDDFSAARNFSFSKATKEFCLWLDADDVLLPEDQERFQDLKKNLTLETDMVMMKYHVGFDEANRPVFSYYRERLIRNGKGYHWIGAVHEVVPQQGRILYSDIGITHKKIKTADPDRNLKIFESMRKKGVALDARQQFYYGRELYYHERYKEAISVLEAFLDSGKGWIENEIEACRQINECYQCLKEPRRGLRALFRSLEYDVPRAEACCDIGAYFMNECRWREAVFWYRTASQCLRRDQAGGFVQADCYDYIPYLQLCVCYDKLGEFDLANLYNELAGQCKPNSKAYLWNREYFSQKLSGENQTKSEMSGN